MTADPLRLTDPDKLTAHAELRGLRLEQRRWLGDIEDEEIPEWRQWLWKKKSFVIPWQYACSMVPFANWGQIYYGMVHGLAGEDSARGFAEKRLGEGDEHAMAVLLADDTFEVIEAVEAQLALLSKPMTLDEVRRPWIPVVFEWVRTGREEPGWWPADGGNDPMARLQTLESVWIALGYPGEVGFVGPQYTPLTGMKALLPHRVIKFLGRDADGASAEQRWAQVNRRLEHWISNECAELKQAER